MSMRDRIAQGKLFTDDCEGLPEDRINAKKHMKAFNDLAVEDIDAREKLMTAIFGRQTLAWIEPPFYFCYGTNIEIGNMTYINCNCNFLDDGKITIGEKVLIGPAVTIATVGHPVDPKLREYMYADPVRIGDNCWIGANAILCPGVTIGENTVIGAGSVVNENIPANVVAAGNPCRIIREINEHDQKYYYKQREITVEDLAEAIKLRAR